MTAVTQSHHSHQPHHSHDHSVAVPVVRPACAEDLEELERFLVDFVGAGRILPRTTDELEQLLPHGFVAEVNDQIVGFAALEVYSKKLAEIRSLCVLPIMQGKGIGKKLTSSCIELARTRNVFEVMVITAADDFFLSCGFDFTLPGQKKALFLQTRDTP